MSGLAQAHEAFSKAALAYEDALAELEAAASRGGEDAEAAHSRLRQASVELARAQAHVQMLSVPDSTTPHSNSFEKIIASGLVGFDLKHEVLDSIVAYQAATSATASAPSIYDRPLTVEVPWTAPRRDTSSATAA